MTAYNRQDYIAEAIESVLASTYTDLELIIVDDCSIDNTVAIARSYEAKDKRIKVYVNEKNLKDYPNRNKAASYARGKYIKYLDSDDKISPDGLEKMVVAMEAFPEAGLGIAQFDTEENENLVFPVCITPRQAYLEHYDGQGILRFGPTGTIIRRDIFLSLNRFGTSRFLGDTEFWLRLAAKYPIVKIEPGVVWWRIHEGQEYQIGHEQHAYLKMSYPIFIKSLLSPGCPLDTADVKRIIARLKWKHARDILRLATVKGRPILAIRFFKEADFGFDDLMMGILSYEKVKDKFKNV